MPVWDDLADGRLLRILALRRPFTHKIYLVSPRNRENSAAVIAFRDWLLQVSAQSQAAFDAAESA